MRLIRPGSVLCWLFAAASALPLAAQTREARSEVELPLSTYDELRGAAKVRRVEAKETPWASARLLRGSLAVDLAARRASWEAEVAAVSAGEEPSVVPLVTDAASIGRSSVSPDGATLQSDSSGTRLLTPQPGTWRVLLAGEISGQGSDESAGLRFRLPRLASFPAAYDLTLPADASATAEGGVVTLGPPKGATRPGRVTLDRDGAATLLVSRAARASSGPPVVDATLHTVIRMTEESVRTEVRLILSVRRGTLSERRLSLPAGSLVSVSGPVLVEGPAADGASVLKLEPAVPEGGTVSLLLALAAPRDATATVFVPALPRLDVSATDRLETELTVVSEGGILLTPSSDDDWSPRSGMEGVRIGADETALGFVSRGGKPRPPSFAVRQLKALAVASALARVSLTVFVGEAGETRTRMVADVRSRGRSTLRFRVPEDASFLAARADGRPAAVSHPAPGLLEVPIDSGSGRTRVELLLGGRGAAPRAGEKLTLLSAAPDEPIERVSWAVVLPPGLSVKEDSKTLAPLGEPPAPRARVREETPPGEKAAAEEAARVAGEDRRARRDGSWSPLATLPAAPVSYTTALGDLDGAVPALTVTLTGKTEKSPWY
ncbi:MAG: hypothetical protein IPN83_05790 [Holophagales bacterium]|nr:hypothetical protein [Holophagales bacterium]